jgi:hypothetical protein
MDGLRRRVGGHARADNQIIMNVFHAALLLRRILPTMRRASRHCPRGCVGATLNGCDDPTYTGCN